ILFEPSVHGSIRSVQPDFLNPHTTHHASSNSSQAAQQAKRIVTPVLLNHGREGQKQATTVLLHHARGEFQIFQQKNRSITPMVLYYARGEPSMEEPAAGYYTRNSPPQP
ncbi:hypothetical protein Dimus_029397, partial [Dionaea muscipula]